MYLFTLRCNFMCLLSNTFAVFDANHDGTISFSEFVLAVAATEKEGYGTALDFAFDM